MKTITKPAFTTASQTVPAENERVLLNALITAFSQSIDVLRKDAVFAKEMLNQGIKTQITTELEGFARNPYLKLFEVREQIDSVFANLADSFMLYCVKTHAPLIDEAVKVENCNGMPGYAIVLKHDTIANREKFFDCLDEYESQRFSSLYPLQWQFVSHESAKKIDGKPVQQNSISL